MKKACYVLRAQPFHLGHLKVIEWILKKSEKIIIVIGSSQESFTHENPFTFEERKKMIDNTLKSEGIGRDRYEIIGIPDVYNGKLWVESILSKVKFDVVYTRNPWTKRCFDLFKIPVKEHPMFGENSGKNIRKRIEQGKGWKDLVHKEVSKIIENIDMKKRLSVGVDCRLH